MSETEKRNELGMSYECMICEHKYFSTRNRMSLSHCYNMRCNKNTFIILNIRSYIHVILYETRIIYFYFIRIKKASAPHLKLLLFSSLINSKAQYKCAFFLNKQSIFYPGMRDVIVN